MPIATGTAIALAAGLGAAGTAASGAIGATEAGNAADAQAAAANNAAGLQYQLGQQNLAFQQGVFNTQQQDLAPWLGEGTAGLANLSSLLGLPVQGNYYPYQGQSPSVPLSNLGGQFAPGGGAGRTPAGQPFQRMGAAPSNLVRLPGGLVPRTNITGGSATTTVPKAGGPKPLSSLVNPSLGAPGSLLAPYPGTFTAPTAVTEQNDPGYQFRLNLGEQALQNSAAARGGLLTGGTATDLENYAQNYASNEYQNVYNRALTDFQTKYNTYNQNQANIFNRLAAISGVGQTAAGQLNQAAGNLGSNTANILSGMGQQVGSNLLNAGAARASGYAGTANALGPMAQQFGNYGNLLPLLSLLQAQQAQSNGGTPPA